MSTSHFFAAVEFLPS